MLGEIIKCPICLKEFVKTNGKQIFCSKRCFNAHRIIKIRKRLKMFNKICPICQAKFVTTNIIKKFCSYKCFHKNKYINWYKNNKSKIIKKVKDYYLNNKNKIYKSKKLWVSKNKKKCTVYQKRWKDNNLEKVIAHRKQYYCNNKSKFLERGRASQHNLRARKKNLSIGKLDTKIIQMVYEDNIKKYGTLTCILCNKKIDFGQDSLEHKLPITRGGTHDYCNLGIAHNNCNKRKYNKTLDEWNMVKEKYANFI